MDIDVLINANNVWWQGYVYGTVSTVACLVLFVTLTYILSFFDKK